jgi:hypothetical protein
VTQSASKIEYNENKDPSILEWMLDRKKQLWHFPLELTICLLAITLSVYHLFVAYAGSLEAHAFRSTHLSFMLVLCFLLRPLGRDKWTDPKNGWFAVDLVLVALTIGIQIYVMWDLDSFIFRRGDLSDTDLYTGTIYMLLLLEATRRAVGRAMVLIAGFFLVQTAFSDYFFSIFYGPPSSWFTMVDYLFMRENGIFSIPLMVMATYIFLFILFGAILVRSGAGRFFINVAMALTGSRVGGPAKASVVSSCLMASVSGSAVANVVTTGSFTIPLMKRIGYRPHFAGAVEACASSGGQIMPPVMGAAAFVIAEFLNIPYLQVALAGLFPAIIYFFLHLRDGPFRSAPAQPGDGQPGRTAQSERRTETRRPPVFIHRGHRRAHGYRLHPHVCGVLGHHLHFDIKLHAQRDAHEPRRHLQRPRGGCPPGDAGVHRLRRRRRHHRLRFCFRIWGLNLPTPSSSLPEGTCGSP